jgi:hypothetical protein
MEDREFYVRYKINDNEMEARGDRQHVNQHTVAFINMVAPKDTPVQLQLPTAIENETPVFLSNTGVTENSSGTNGQHHNSPQDLISFYRKLAPKSQHDQIMIITYYSGKFDGREQLSSPGDYKQAYSKLGKIPVSEPANLSARVNELVDRGLLYRLDTGLIEITLIGEEYVENLAAALD